MIPRNPLDVLAQQIVAMTVMDRWTVDELAATIGRAAPFESLSREALEGVLGMLAGAYPSDEFAELKARIVWDRVTGVVEGRRDARVVAVTSGGTIPDRGLFGVFLVGEAGTPGRRVGELDEEMVYELRAGMHGDVVVLGASSLAGPRDRPRSGDRRAGAGRAGQAAVLARRCRRSADRARPGARRRWCARSRPTSGEAPVAGRPRSSGSRSVTTSTRSRPRTCVAYLEDELEVAGALPTDRRIVVERFRDELGDWRLCLLTPFGGRVHAPWSLALEARLGERLGAPVQTIWSDDGIAIRLPEGELGGSILDRADGLPAAIEDLLFPDRRTRSRTWSSASSANSALFAARFRENAARALLLPRRRPGTRTPLWQQRQRSADLLAVASRYGSFPILVETYRECLSDVFDLPALKGVLAGVARREIDVHRVETTRASPFASSLLFDYVAAYMYEGDAPLAERRAQALTLDRDLLRELLGQEELRELLDGEALADLELRLQALSDDRAATTLDQLHDLLRRLGDLTELEVAGRVEGGREVAEGWLAELARGRRAVPVRISGQPGATAGSRSRMSPGIATRSASSRRRVSRRPSSSRRPLRSRGSSRAGRGPTVRSCRAIRPTRWGLPVGHRRGRPPPDDGRGHPPAGRVPARRRGARMVRPGGAAAAAAALAGPTAARGRAGRAGAAGPVPGRVAGGRRDRRPGR